MAAFNWGTPEENWCKMPHALINALPTMTSEAEVKVILYVLRHTWGYHETDEGKHITIDEFIKGRKRKDGTRIDKGLRLSETAIKDGIRRAVAHGYLCVTGDDRDKARKRRFYRLSDGRGSELEGQKLTLRGSELEGQKLTLRGSEVDPRTEKESIERKHSIKETMERKPRSPPPLSEGQAYALQALTKACPAFDSPASFIEKLNTDQCALLVEWCAKASLNNQWATSKGAKLPGLIRAMVERGESAEVQHRDIERLKEMINIDQHYAQLDAEQPAAPPEQIPLLDTQEQPPPPPTDPAATQWATLLTELSKEMPSATYNTWVRDTVPLATGDDHWTIGAPNPFGRDWLNARLRIQVQRKLSSMLGHKVNVTFAAMAAQEQAA